MLKFYQVLIENGGNLTTKNELPRDHLSDPWF
jgi:hypothetical protein